MTDTIFEAAVLLGLTKGHKPVKTIVEIAERIDEGLPLSAVDHVVSVIAPHDTTLRYVIVPKATYSRYARAPRSQRRLNKYQSAALARVARVWTAAIHVWKDANDARDFLYHPHMMLQNRRPIDLAIRNDVGAQAVCDILGRLEYGSAA